MADRIPDLWRLGEDANRLYSLYLVDLLRNHRYEQVIAASQQIRHYAARGPGPETALFALSWELEAFCGLGQYQDAWRRLRRDEVVALGRRVDLRARRWDADEVSGFEYNHVPLLYFLGRYRMGCRLLEAVLEPRFLRKKVRSFDMLCRVFNGEREPTDRCRVTLAHFYRHLGKDLTQWSRWEPFVNGFHPRLFRLAEIPRDQLMADSRLLSPFFDRLMSIRDDRTRMTRIGGEERDLTDSEATVAERQEAIRNRLHDFEEQHSPRRAMLDAKLAELFSDLRTSEDQ